MARQARDGLSQTPKGFRISVGKRSGADGVLRERVFWLGHDRAVALYASDVYRGIWDGILRREDNEWRIDDEKEAVSYIDFFKESRKRLRDRLDFEREELSRRERLMADVLGSPGGSASPESAAVTKVLAQPSPFPVPAAALAAAPDPATPNVPTLYQAIAAFLESFKGKRRSDSHKLRAQQVLEVNLKHARKDCGLAEINYLWLDRLADHFKARPPSLKDKKPIKPQTVKVILQYLRQFFVWLDDTNFGGWQGPQKLTKPFRVRLDELMTDAEKRSASEGHGCR